MAADGVYSEGSAAFHEDDTYNPIEADDLPARLAGAGFREVEVRVHELGWICTCPRSAG